jgi:Carbohydrate family 9 binding domain-like
VIPLLLAALLPGLLLNEPPPDVSVFKQVPDVRIYVPAEHVPKWSMTGVAVADAASLKGYVPVPPPRIRMQTAAAAATALPWIDSNGWRVERGASKILYAKLPEKTAPLAAAEAFAFGADAVLEPAPADVPAVLRMLAFLQRIDQPVKPVLANIGLVDNGSPALPEVMNLLTRRNLTYRVVSKPDPSLDLNVEIGSGEFTAKDAANPHEFAQKIRQKLGDEKRILRLFNTSTVLGRVTGDKSGSRVHLLNYGTRPVSWVQVRILGSYAPPRLRSFDVENTTVTDFRRRDGGTEFTIPHLNTYAVVDLPPASEAVLISRYSAADFGLTADPNAPEWRAVEPIVLDTDFAGNPTPGHRTEVRSRWSPNYLHVLYANSYQRLNLKPNPDTTQETPQLWNWDVSEIFIGSDPEQITRYKEFQVSPQGEWVDLDIDRTAPKGQVGAQWNSGITVRARIDAQARMWYGEMRIPFRDLGISRPQPGLELRAGVYRIAGAAPDRVYLSWQVTNGRSFHVPENFGTIRLGARP